ncbi:hypothetical protein Pst134EB_003839 [Puccinia striiformis f. sp. tritici]|nr:hypothetical protein Pst134EB_003839 [Puccinia striiformis f. sp. tritici]
MAESTLERLSPDASFFDSSLAHHQPDDGEHKPARFFQSPSPENDGHNELQNEQEGRKHPASPPLSPRLNKKTKLTTSPENDGETHNTADQTEESGVIKLSAKDASPQSTTAPVETPSCAAIEDKEREPKQTSNPNGEPESHSKTLETETAASDDRQPKLISTPESKPKLESRVEYDVDEPQLVKPDYQTKLSNSNFIDLTDSPDSPDCIVIPQKISNRQKPDPSCPPEPTKDVLPSWERKYIGAFMCEGYLIYSSAKLREGESVWLSRSSTNETKKNHQKSISTKREDHVVRLESKKNGAFARLNETFAKWIVKLIDQRLVAFEGKLMFPPTKSAIGATVHCYLKAYVLESAFVSPTDEKFNSGSNLQKSKLSNFYNSPESKEDKPRIERQESVNKLFETINLIASISSTSTTMKSNNRINTGQNSTNVKGDPDGAEDGIDQQNIDLVYQKATAHDMSLDMRPPCDGFELPLRPYQQQGLSWLMKMELTLEDAREEVSIHPLWEEYVFPGDEEDASFNNLLEERFYYNPYMGEFSLEFPRASRKCQGGILADEMGLGKTIQMAALICTARPPHHPLVKPQPESDDDDDDDAGYGSDKKPQIKSQDQVAPQSDITPFQLGSKKKNSPGKSHATLVVCPLTLLDQWKDELERCHKALKVFVYHSATKGGLNASTDKYDVVITTYNIVANEWGTIEPKAGGVTKLVGLFKVDWYRIILDEGHNIKNRNAQASKACYNLSGSRRWVLSGTPIVNRLEDLASLLHFIRLEPWGNFSFYRSFVTIPFSKKDPKALVVVQTIIESILLRREKKMKDLNGQPIVSLPPKQVDLAYLELNRKERMVYDMVYNNAKSEYMEYLGQGTVLSNVTAILAILMRLRQAVLHPLLVLKKLKISPSSTDDVKTVAKMLEEYENSPYGSFANSQWKDLEKKLKGNHELGGVEEEECVMCLDVMDSRVYLPCMHAFCKECIMNYIENKAGEKTICPTCESPFQETGIVEFVMNRSKNASNPSSVPSTPGGQSATISEDEEVSSDPPVQRSINSTPHLSSSSQKVDLDYEIPLENFPKSSIDCEIPLKNFPQSSIDHNDEDDDGIGGGYLKRNDFISSTKLDALTDHLINARKIDPKFSAVVFSQFTGFLDLIEQVLKRDKFRFVRLDGTLSTRKRKKVLQTFNVPNRPCILVCSLKVAGVGLNLIKANRVYLMDTWWNEAIENQAIDRVHRFGQDKPTYIVRFLVSNSIEDRMLSIQRKKRSIINDALGGDKSSSSSKVGKAQALEDFQAIFAD